MAHTVKYLRNMHAEYKRMKTRVSEEAERRETMEEESQKVYKDLYQVIHDFQLPVEEGLLGGEQWFSEQPNSDDAEAHEEETTIRATRVQHGPDRQTRLRAAGFDSTHISTGGRNNTIGNDRQDNGRRRSSSLPARRRTKGKGGPEDGDDDSSPSSGKDYNPDPHPRMPRKRRSSSSESDREVNERSRGGMNPRFFVPSAAPKARFISNASSASMIRRGNPSSKLTDNSTQYILRMLRDILTTDPDDTPAVSKHFKAATPSAYGGEDDVELFYLGE